MMNRLIIILIFVPILFFIFIKGNYSLLLFCEVVSLFSVYEFYKMLKSRAKSVYLIYGCLISALIPILVFYNILSISEILTLAFLLIAIIQVFTGTILHDTEQLAYTFLGIIYIPVLFSYILKLSNFNHGNILILYSFSCIWACDTLAYVFGRLFGKHKFSSISPKKTIEGLIGGILGVLFTVNLFPYFYYYISLLLSKIPYLGISCVYHEFIPKFSIESLIFSLIVAFVSILGDLFESKIKRELNYKDSSNILLGHGGFLDRFDSSLFTLPIIYLYFSYLN